MTSDITREKILHRLKSLNEDNYDQLALDIYQYQYKQCEVYRKWCDALSMSSPQSFCDIPYLPISTFKHHEVMAGDWIPEARFQSSGTTSQCRSEHLIRDLSTYTKRCVDHIPHYVPLRSDTRLYALLPSYQEQSQSSLLHMVEAMGDRCDFQGYYGHRLPELYEHIHSDLANDQTIWLIGVSYALLDLAQQGYISGRIHVTYTGGMKGRGRELTHAELTQTLQRSWPQAMINVEYGMTELQSQAWAEADGWLCPGRAMRLTLATADNPLRGTMQTRGIGRIADLYNLDSCSFIATEDLVERREDGSFRILGRLDHSDLRGCNLLYVSS